MSIIEKLICSLGMERSVAGTFGVLHEAETRLDAPEALRELLDLQPLRLGHRGHVGALHGKDDVPLVQHLVVLETVQQRSGRTLGIACEEHRRTGYRRRRPLGSEATSSLSGTSESLVFSASSREPSRQVHISKKIAAPSASGIQPPSRTLSALAPKNTRSSASSGSMTGSTSHSGHFQSLHITADGHHGGDHHRAGNRDAIGWASAPEELKASTSTMTPASSSQFTCGR